jgi:uncharacterized protein (DUF433 family)
MATATLDNLIVRQTNIHHGSPSIAGTGVAVRSVVGHYKLGLTPEDIAHEMMLDLASVYAALTYYHLNREAIEADIAANQEALVKSEMERE